MGVGVIKSLEGIHPYDAHILSHFHVVGEAPLPFDVRGAPPAISNNDKRGIVRGQFDHFSRSWRVVRIVALPPMDKARGKNVRWYCTTNEHRHSPKTIAPRRHPSEIKQHSTST